VQRGIRGLEYPQTAPREDLTTDPSQRAGDRSGGSIVLKPGHWYSPIGWCSLLTA